MTAQDKADEQAHVGDRVEPDDYWGFLGRRDDADLRAENERLRNELAIIALSADDDGSWTSDGHGRCTERAAAALSTPAPPPASRADDPKPIAQFGRGTLVVDTGHHYGTPAVFVGPSKRAGPVGGKVPDDEKMPNDRLIDGEFFFTFPTDEQAKLVADALVNTSRADADLRAAFIDGAMSTHKEWLRAHEAGEAPPRGEPEFGEAADDYVALRSSPWPDADLRAAVVEAIDLLAERKHGSQARSPGHNARLVLEAALSATAPSRPDEGAINWRDDPDAIVEDDEPQIGRDYA